MKKHLSVFYLIARESIYKICLLSAVLFSVQAAIYFACVYSAETVFPIEQFFGWDEYYVIRLIFYAGLVFVSLLLGKTGMQFNSGISYTLRRLRVSEKTVFVHQSIYNFIMLMLFLVTEVLVLFLLVNFTVLLFPEEFESSQTVYKTFYDGLFLQNVFAGRDAIRGCRNIVCLASLGVNAAAFSYLFRRGKKWIFGILFLASLCLPFTAIPSISEAGLDVAFCAVGIVMFYAAAISVFMRGEQYET